MMDTTFFIAEREGVVEYADDKEAKIMSQENAN